jgi:hypothetical protein
MEVYGIAGDTAHLIIGGSEGIIVVRLREQTQIGLWNR